MHLLRGEQMPHAFEHSPLAAFHVNLGVQQRRWPITSRRQMLRSEGVERRDVDALTVLQRRIIAQGEPVRRATADSLANMGSDTDLVHCVSVRKVARRRPSMDPVDLA